MVEKRRSDVDSAKRHQSIAQTLHSIIFDNELNKSIDTYYKIEIEEQKNVIEQLERRLSFFESSNVNSTADSVNEPVYESKAEPKTDCKTEPKSCIKAEASKECIMIERLLNEIKNLDKQILQYKNEATRSKNTVKKEEVLKSVIKTKEEDDFLERKIDNLEKENLSLKNEINKNVTEILNERKNFIKKIEKMNFEFENFYKKNNEENEKINKENFELKMKLKETKNELEIKNEKYKKLKEEIENTQNILSDTNKENKNDAGIFKGPVAAVNASTGDYFMLYQEIIRLTNLYEKSLEHAILYEKMKETANVTVSGTTSETASECVSREMCCQKLKELENKNLLILNAENLKYEKLMNDFIERKNAANYHKRNAIKNYEELEALKKRLEFGNKEIVNDLENYRKLLRCTSCDRNYKDTIILKCMHVFCKECIDNRIKTRNRNCPTCNENFHTADIKKIYL